MNVKEKNIVEHILNKALSFDLLNPNFLTKIPSEIYEKTLKGLKGDPPKTHGVFKWGGALKSGGGSQKWGGTTDAPPHFFLAVI